MSRAFVAARALSQALATGRDIVNKATKVGLKYANLQKKRWQKYNFKNLPFVTSLGRSQIGDHTVRKVLVSEIFEDLIDSFKICFRPQKL